MSPLFETLEDRVVLSTTTLTLDGADKFSGAVPLGKVAGIVKINNSLSAGEAHDFFSFSVRSRGNVNLTLGGLASNANLRLLDSTGRVLGSSARRGARSEHIGRSLKRGTYVFSIDRGKRGADTSYTLTLQSDLNYQTISIDGQNYTIGVIRADGGSAPIVTNRETWVVIHGWMSKPDATQHVADAIDAASKGNQVLQVDWSQAAADANSPAVILRVPDVGAFVAQKLTGWGIPNALINLAGHSFGGYMIDEIARRISGGVDRIVALDPSTVALDGIDFSNTDYAAHSKYSIAFVGSDFGTLSAAQTADETINVNVGDRSSFAAHGAVRELFAGITRQNNTRHPGSISPLFSLRAISSPDGRHFLRDGMGSGYEATLAARSSSGQWIPKTLTYKDASTGKTVTITA